MLSIGGQGDISLKYHTAWLVPEEPLLTDCGNQQKRDTALKYHSQREVLSRNINTFQLVTLLFRQNFSFKLKF